MPNPSLAIDDETAWSYYDGLDEATGVERIEKENALRFYAQEQRRVALESQHEEMEKVYTDPAYFQKFTGAQEIVDAELYSLRPEEVRYKAANQAYLNLIAQRELSAAEYPIYRDGMAQSVFDYPRGGKGIGEKELFEKISKAMLGQQELRKSMLDLERDSLKEGFEALVDGRPVDITTQYNKWREANAGKIPAEYEGPSLTRARTMVQDTGELLRRYQPQAATVWELVTLGRKGLATGEDITLAASRLKEIPTADRKQLLHMATVATSDLSEDERDAVAQVLGNTWKSLRQATERYIGFDPTKPKSVVGGFLAQSQQDRENELRTRIQYLEGGTIPKELPYGMAGNIPELLRQDLSPEERAAEITKARDELDTLAVVREIQGAFASADAIKPVFEPGGFFSAGTLEQGLYGLAGTLPMIATMIAGGPVVGPALQLDAYQREGYERLMSQNPGMDPRVASGLSFVSAAPQAGLDMVEFSVFAGRMPLTADLFHNIQNSVVRLGARAGTAIAVENVVELAQDLIADFVPVLAANIRADMPDVDPGPVLDELLAARPATFWALLLPSLGGAGIATLRDFKDPGLLFNPRLLAYQGYSEEQIATIRNSIDPYAALQEQRALRKPADIKQGQAAFEEDLGHAREAQVDPLRPTMEIVTKADGTKEYRVVRSVPDEIEADLVPAAELEGKQATLQFIDPATGRTATQTLAAAEAQDLVKDRLDIYRQLIDCLGK